LHEAAGVTAPEIVNRLTRSLDGVDGFLYLDEAWALHETVRQFPSSQELSVVEIGSWKGRSTIALALGVQVRGTGRVFAIDPHSGGQEMVEMYGAVDTFAEFNDNLERAGVKEVVEPIRALAHLARPRFRNGSVQVLFIDGSHLYSDVLQDIDDWLTALSDQAVVAFNDPSAFGVYRALRERVLHKGSDLRQPKLVRNTLFFRVFRGAQWSARDTRALTQLRISLFLRYRASLLWPYVPSSLTERLRRPIGRRETRGFASSESRQAGARRSSRWRP
jgi:hypothetical protein